jgi:hypothetical protein
MALTGYISVGLPIGPNVDNDPYFVTNPRYGLGGLRTVGNTAERDSIISQRREIGMMVYVSGNNKFYYLSGGTGNSYWTEFTGSSGGGGGAVTGVFGTPDEIEVSPNTGNVTVGLPKAVNITETINIGGITIGITAGNQLYIDGTLNVFGNLNTIGTLMVDGFIITKTGFQGFTGTADLEPIEHVTLDGGDY